MVCPIQPLGLGENDLLWWKLFLEMIFLNKIEIPGSPIKISRTIFQSMNPRGLAINIQNLIPGGLATLVSHHQREEILTPGIGVLRVH